MKCGVLNSQVEGMLFQCGKCKRAYYCSAQCFNADLVNHQVYCNTGKLQTQPKVSSSEDSTTACSSQSTRTPPTRNGTIASSSQSTRAPPTRNEKKSVRQRFDNMKLTKIREETKPCDSVHVEPVGGRSEDASLDDETSLYDCSGDYDSDSEDSDFSYERPPINEQVTNFTRKKVDSTSGAQDTVVEDGDQLVISSVTRTDKSEYSKGRAPRELEDKAKGKSQGQCHHMPSAATLTDSPSPELATSSSSSSVASHQKKAYEWEKPSWATSSPLRKSAKRGELSQSGRVSTPGYKTS